MKTPLLAILGGDYTPLEHAAYAVAIQIGVWLVCWGAGVADGVIIGAAAAVAFFYGREHAQAEDRLRPALGQRTAEIRATLFWRWDWGSQMDLYTPAIVVFVITSLAM